MAVTISAIHLLSLQYDAGNPFVEEYLGRLRILCEFQVRSEKEIQRLSSSLGVLDLGTQPPIHQDAQAFVGKSTWREIQNPSWPG